VRSPGNDKTERATNWFDTPALARVARPPGCILM
jgi:hypothetical protein